MAPVPARIFISALFHAPGQKKCTEEFDIEDAFFENVQKGELKAEKQENESSDFTLPSFKVQLKIHSEAEEIADLKAQRLKEHIIEYSQGCPGCYSFKTGIVMSKNNNGRIPQITCKKNHSSIQTC